MNIDTTKKKSGLFFEGYFYRFAKRTADGQKYWRCVVKNCSGSLKTEEDDSNAVVLNSQHSHIGNPDNMHVRQTMNTIKERAVRETAAMSKIYSEEVATLAGMPAAAAQMPPLRQVSEGLYKNRRAHYPPIPADRTLLVLPPPMTQTQDGKQFLLHAEPGNEFLLFATDANLRLLCEADIVSMDGTFDACPHLYGQLFTLHVFAGERLLPVVYCLLPNKTAAVYTSVFQVLMAKAVAANTVFSPGAIMSDFETGIIQAVAACFPQAHHQGCYFHFTQVGTVDIQ